MNNDENSVVFCLSFLHIFHFAVVLKTRTQKRDNTKDINQNAATKLLERGVTLEKLFRYNSNVVIFSQIFNPEFNMYYLNVHR